ncbi:transcription factor bHLH130-like [Glycine soja]|uniref:transcription factor bHLH130-like n=1 Tax=Glycine soja TaxID=3848 RepID=UPI0010405FB3|nr:transcription factor bHLH130-like [Glycine soja]
MTGLKRFRDEDVKPFSGLNAPESQNEIRGQQPSSSALAHQLSLPNTSTEMTAIEKFLQLSDFVPSKIRAKRGCATHPRSIAERIGSLLAHAWKVGPNISLISIVCTVRYLSKLL